MRRTLGWTLAITLASSSCGKPDDAEHTDLAKRQLQAAQAEITEHSKAVADNQADIDRTKRELSQKQDHLADDQKVLEQQRQQLGSAEVALAAARVAYAAAVTERLAKLDALLAKLSTKTDAKSTDAAIGLGPRRDQLAAKLATAAATSDPNWDAYTKDIDVTFAAIEHDLHAALN
jgi:chromosome segregation ATPase